jgi:hypothetical protein
MSETTLHPQNAAPAKSIITPRQNMTEYQALRQLGFIRGFDFVMLSLLIGHLVFFGFWKFFANPSTNSLLLGAVQCLDHTSRLDNFFDLPVHAQCAANPL